MRKLIFFLLTSIMLMSISLAFPVFSTSATLNVTTPSYVVITNQDQNKEFTQIEYRGYKIPSGNYLRIEFEKILAYKKIDVKFIAAKTVEGTPRSITLTTANVIQKLSNGQQYSSGIYTFTTPLTDFTTQWVELRIYNPAITVDLMVTLNVNVIKDNGVVTGNITAILGSGGNDVNMYAESSDGVARATSVDVNNNLNVNVATNLAGEDLTNNIIAVNLMPVSGTAYVGSSYQNNSFVSVNVKSTAGNVIRISAYNSTGSRRFLQIHNTSTVPAPGATALYKYYVPAGTQLVLGVGDLGVNGLPCSVGIAVSNSTTLGTMVNGTAGDLVIDLGYI